ncbi:MAG: PorP/SprF family type IX secretion system membrane protein [Bacteroidota bacterium]|nr:PorP/SprF family type IX secretion system membrane protein [Bacteroidota bacterium]
MKKLRIILVIFVLTGALQTKAQDIHFSQISEVPLLLNPANTGFFPGYFRAIVNYRNQWQSMGKAFQTANLSVDAGLFKSKRRKAFLGLGLVMFQDRAGAAKLTKTHAMVNISGLVKLSKKSVLCAGIYGGAIGNTADYTKLTYASQFDGNSIDPEANTGENAVFRNYTTTDLGMGIAYEASSVKIDTDHDDVTKVRIGLAAYHLNRPKQEFAAGSVYRLPMRLVASLFSNIDFEDTRFTLTPAFVLQKQGKKDKSIPAEYKIRGAYEFVTGSYFKVRLATGTKVTGEKTQNAIGFGLYYRSKDALIPKLILELGDYAIGMSYDVNISGYKSASKSNGGFEVTLRYNRLANSLFDTRSEF